VWNNLISSEYICGIRFMTDRIPFLFGGEGKKSVKIRVDAFLA